MKRYSIKRITEHECVMTIIQDCDLGYAGEAVTYWRPAGGGYVYDTTDHPGTSGLQVCEGLSPVGTALYQNDKGELTTLIRREAKRCLRQEA
jgi:hypothetical protein